MERVNHGAAGLNEGYRVELPLFQGPLDLLLHLIEQEQLDITKVALALVTDQYLAYLATLQQISAEVLTDFLVVAARLVLIKSQALLPRPPSGPDREEDPGDQLARQLVVYRQFKRVAQLLSQRETAGMRMFVRAVAPPQVEPRLVAGEGRVSALRAAMLRVLAVRPPEPAVDQVVSPIVLTVGRQIGYVRERLSGAGQLSFTQLLGEAAHRVEIIVTLMAVLELIKQNVADVRQDGLFGDIIIYDLAGQSSAVR